MPSETGLVYPISKRMGKYENESESESECESGFLYIKRKQFEDHRYFLSGKISTEAGFFHSHCLLVVWSNEISDLELMKVWKRYLNSISIVKPNILQLAFHILRFTFCEIR